MSLQRTADEVHAMMLDRRDIYPEDVCTACSGYGVKQYSSTATWRGGVGGQAMSCDVCDACWGSGSATKTWLNLRTRRDQMDAEVNRRALTLLADVCMTNYATMTPSRFELAKELEKMAAGRKTRPPFFTELCTALAKVLTKR